MSRPQALRRLGVGLAAATAATRHARPAQAAQDGAAAPKTQDGPGPAKEDEAASEAIYKAGAGVLPTGRLLTVRI